MPFPPGDYVKMVHAGAVAGGESWSFGIWYEVTGLISLPSPTQMNTLAGHLSTNFQAFWTTLKARNQPGVDARSVSAYFYRNGQLAVQSNAGFAAVPGTAAAIQPVYVSRVVTLLTARAGRSYRGRLYLPYTGTNLSGSTNLWNSDSTTLTALKSLVTLSTSDIITDLAGTTAGPVVYSNTVGGHEPVTSLRMDNKPDTQRGREGRLAATLYDTATIP